MRCYENPGIGDGVWWLHDEMMVTKKEGSWRITVTVSSLMHMD